VQRLPDWAVRGRAKWSNTGAERPAFAVAPGAEQESVWDYPRPPLVVADRRKVEIKVGSRLVAQTTRALRVLETASPPTFYLPPDALRFRLQACERDSSRCEWKGLARYLTVEIGDVRLEAVAWSYPDPFIEYAALRDYVSFYPARIDCYVDDERVMPQPGEFYGGWVTREIVGPFKGEPGSEDW
jgi:uncharacterized protein (DUF427 family)